MATGRGWARAAALRGWGLLARDAPPEAEDRLSAAFDGFRAVGAPFDEARTLLARGRHRIRSGDHGPGPATLPPPARSSTA